MSPRGIPNSKPDTDDTEAQDVAFALNELAKDHAASLKDWLGGEVPHQASEHDAVVYDTLRRAADLLSA